MSPGTSWDAADAAIREWARLRSEASEADRDDSHVKTTAARLLASALVESAFRASRQQT